MIKNIKTTAYAGKMPRLSTGAAALFCGITLCCLACHARAQTAPPQAAPASPSPLAAAQSVSEPLTAPVGNWITDSKSGCKLFTRRPIEGMSVDWSGTCDDAGQASGHGTVSYFRNGAKEAVCNGNFRNGLLEGLTHCTFKEGAKYDVEYKAGQFNGKGRYVEANGDYYEGDFAPGGRNGHIVGQEHHGDALCKVDGEYRKNDLYYGEINCDDGSMAKGYFTSNRLSKGLIVHKDGSRQEGEFDAQVHLIKSYPVTAPLTPEELARFNATLANGKPAQIYYLAGQFARQGHTAESEQLYQKLVDDFPDDVYTAKAIDRMDHAYTVVGARAGGQSARAQEQHDSCIALCQSQAQQCNADALSGAMPGATQAVTGAMSGSGSLTGMLSGLGSVLMSSTKDCDTPLRACVAACPP
jgi:hypothetical protein